MFTAPEFCISAFKVSTQPAQSVLLYIAGNYYFKLFQLSLNVIFVLF